MTVASGVDHRDEVARVLHERGEARLAALRRAPPRSAPRSRARARPGWPARRQQRAAGARRARCSRRSSGAWAAPRCQRQDDRVRALLRRPSALSSSGSTRVAALDVARCERAELSRRASSAGVRSTQSADDASLASPSRRRRARTVAAPATSASTASSAAPCDLVRGRAADERRRRRRSAARSRATERSCWRTSPAMRATTSPNSTIDAPTTTTVEVAAADLVHDQRSDRRDQRGARQQRRGGSGVSCASRSRRGSLELAPSTGAARRRPTAGRSAIQPTSSQSWWS